MKRKCCIADPSKQLINQKMCSNLLPRFLTTVVRNERNWWVSALDGASEMSRSRSGCYVTPLPNKTVKQCHQLISRRNICTRVWVVWLYVNFFRFHPLICVKVVFLHSCIQRQNIGTNMTVEADPKCALYATKFRIQLVVFKKQLHLSH